MEELINTLKNNLSEEDVEKLLKFGEKVKNPHNMSREEILKALEETGIDPEKIKKEFNKARVAGKQKVPKIGANEPCPCESGKKWKKCCRKI